MTVVHDETREKADTVSDLPALSPQLADSGHTQGTEPSQVTGGLLLSMEPVKRWIIKKLWNINAARKTDNVTLNLWSSQNR